MSKKEVEVVHHQKNKSVSFSLPSPRQQEASSFGLKDNNKKKL